jgi:hypothetical protein
MAGCALWDSACISVLFRALIISGRSLRSGAFLGGESRANEANAAILAVAQGVRSATNEPNSANMAAKTANGWEEMRRTKPPRHPSRGEIGANEAMELPIRRGIGANEAILGMQH